MFKYYTLGYLLPLLNVAKFLIILDSSSVKIVLISRVIVWKYLRSYMQLTVSRAVNRGVLLIILLRMLKC